MLLPVLQRIDRKSKPTGELRLRVTQALTDRRNIDLVGYVHSKPLPSLTPRERTRRTL